MSSFRHFCLSVIIVGLYFPSISAQDTFLNAIEANKDGYRFSRVDISKRVLWGSINQSPDGSFLLFSGQDQDAADGNPHTQIKKDGVFVTITKELQAKNPLQKYQERVWALRIRQKNLNSKYRFIYLKGLTTEETAKRVKEQCIPEQEIISKELETLLAEIKEASKKLAEYELLQSKYATAYLDDATAKYKTLIVAIKVSLKSKDIGDLRLIQIQMEKSSEALDAEPPARNLSPLVYDAKTKLFVLFGGDHQDYITNDTWVFDFAKQKWMQRHPKTAPNPRLNHHLKAAGDGKISLNDGATYSAIHDLAWVQYKDINDGEWIYNIETDTWSGKDGIASDSRTYRPETFLPEYYLEESAPNAITQEAFLKNIPVNTWVDLKPSKLPPGNRTWGTIALDTDRDMLLRWSGGHSAYCGTEVVQYHLSTNKWEMPFPAENPMGETCSEGAGTSGVNFNLRPSMTGHTYHSYGYDAISKKMLSVGRGHIYGRKPEEQDLTYHVYDPEIADWSYRGPKPKEMFYAESYYTLIVCGTPQGTYVWTKDGNVLKYNADKKEWVAVTLTGIPMPGSSCDGASLQYDSKRNRLIAIRTVGWNTKFEGEVYEIDLKTMAVRSLNPTGKKALSGMTFVREAAYDSQNDIFLVAASIAPEGATPLQIPFYDCEKNKWMGITIEGKDLYGKLGIDVGLGLVYDNKRKLYWAVNARSEIVALRLDIKTAKITELQ